MSPFAYFITGTMLGICIGWWVEIQSWVQKGNHPYSNIKRAFGQLYEVKAVRGQNSLSDYN